MIITERGMHKMYKWYKKLNTIKKIHSYSGGLSYKSLKKG